MEKTQAEQAEEIDDAVRQMISDLRIIRNIAIMLFPMLLVAFIKFMIVF